MKIKSLLYYGQRNIQVTDYELRTPKEDEVLIKVSGAGLCQTQVNEFIEGPYIINKTSHGLTGVGIPLIVGHEFGGVVEKVGSPENNDLVGRQAAVLPLLSCGKCGYCRQGWNNLCDDMAYYGLCGENGGFAEYACIKKENLYFVEDKNLLTFVEPILVAIHAGNMINDIRGKKICVLGAGAIGICVAAVFRDYFGGRVEINDILPNRLERAQNAGIEIVQNTSLKADYDIVVDCAGNDSTSKSSAFTEGFDYLQKGGELVNIGTYFHPIPIIPSAILVKENKMITSYLYCYEDVSILSRVINSLGVDFSIFISNIKLENIIEDGYYRAEVDKDSFTRLVVVP